jgi:Ca2+-binding RTX toxin-like protein
MAFTINTSSTAQQILSAVNDFGVVTQNGSISTTGTCVSMSGEGSALLNQGLIASGSVSAFATNDVYIANSGRILGKDNALQLSISGTNDTTSKITNSGEMISLQGRALWLLESGAQVLNHGLISGGSSAVVFGSSSGTNTSKLVNTGTLSAGDPSSASLSAVLGFGEVRIDNAGLIFGRVTLGLGNDVVDNRLGEISGQISMGDGNNLCRGGAGDEDVVAGTGADTLRGGTGDDTLTGGEGADLLMGGRGADTFVFAQADESAPGALDLIRGFNRKEDVIDISALATTPFAFTGTDPLAGGGAPSVGYVRNGTVLTVSADVDGNGTADLVFQLTGTNALTSANFLL